MLSSGFPAKKEFNPNDNKKRLFNPSYMWMPRKSAKEYLIVENEPVRCIIHNPPNEDGSYLNNIIPCQVGTYQDTVCEELWASKAKGKEGNFFTSIDFSKFVSEKTQKTYQFEMKIVKMGFSEAAKFEDLATNECGGTLGGSLIKAKRFSNDKSPGIGESFSFVRKPDLAKSFAFVQYNGRKLSEIFDEANKDSDMMKEVRRIWKVELDKFGKIIPKIYSFNFDELLKAPTPEYLRKKYNLDNSAQVAKTIHVPIPPSQRTQVVKRTNAQLLPDDVGMPVDDEDDIPF